MTRINTPGMCDAPPPSIVLDGVDYSASCSYATAAAVYRLGVKRDQPTYYSKDPACTAHAAESFSDYYELIAASPTDFPKLLTMIE